MWDQEKFIRAIYYAANAHGIQKLPGSNLPYIIHVTHVCSELMNLRNTKFDFTFMLQCACLHDVLEDTNIIYADLLIEFGEEIAKSVSALSKNKKLEKEDQMVDSLNRIRQLRKEVWVVKLADRIANLNPPPSYWSESKKLAYIQTSKLILEKLGSSSEELAQRLKLKIETYKSYI